MLNNVNQRIIKLIIPFEYLNLLKHKIINMKNFLFAILFSIIGGFTAIGGYNLWENKSNVIAIDYNDKIKLANYIFDTTDVIVPEGLNFIYTAKVTTPSVVHIRTTYEGRNSGTRNPFGDMFRDFFGERYDYREREMPKRRGTGSGVIMSKNGYIITNCIMLCVGKCNWL